MSLFTDFVEKFLTRILF